MRARRLLPAPARRLIRRVLGPQGNPFNRLRREFGGLGDVRRAALSLHDREHADIAARDAVLFGFDRRLAALSNRVLDLEDRLEAPPAERLGTEAAIFGDPETLVGPQLYHSFLVGERSAPRVQSSRLARYCEWLRHSSPVLDLACGRSQLLHALAGAGITSHGVDRDPVAVAECRRAGLEAVEAKPFVALAAAEVDSIGAIVAIALVEQLEPRQVLRLLRLSRRALKSGGLLLLETANPASFLGLTRFYRDPHNVRPHHPAALRLLVEGAGFEVIRIEFECPVEKSEPASASLHASPLSVEASGDPVPGPDEIDELARSYQHYALVARHP